MHQSIVPCSESSTSILPTLETRITTIYVSTSIDGFFRRYGMLGHLRTGKPIRSFSNTASHYFVGIIKLSLAIHSSTAIDETSDIRIQDCSSGFNIELVMLICHLCQLTSGLYCGWTECDALRYCSRLLKCTEVLLRTDTIIFRTYGQYMLLPLRSRIFRPIPCYRSIEVSTLHKIIGWVYDSECHRHVLYLAV